MVFSRMEHRYLRVVFQLLKQIVQFLRQMIMPAVHMQISRFICKTATTRFSKASVTLSGTGFIGIYSQVCFVFFLCAMLLFCTAASPFSLLTNGSDSFFINFLTALPFFLFSMFFMFKGVFHVFCFTVVMFFSVCMF